MEYKNEDDRYIYRLIISCTLHSPESTAFSRFLSTRKKCKFTRVNMRCRKKNHIEYISPWIYCSKGIPWWYRVCRSWTGSSRWWNPYCRTDIGPVSDPECYSGLGQSGCRSRPISPRPTVSSTILFYCSCASRILSAGSPLCICNSKSVRVRCNSLPHDGHYIVSWNRPCRSSGSCLIHSSEFPSHTINVFVVLAVIITANCRFYHNLFRGKVGINFKCVYTCVKCNLNFKSIYILCGI